MDFDLHPFYDKVFQAYIVTSPVTDGIWKNAFINHFFLFTSFGYFLSLSLFFLFVFFFFLLGKFYVFLEGSN